MSAVGRVVLVGCGAAKLERRARARELYTSNLFRMSLAHAESLAPAARIFVLSALHGIVPLDKEIDPYERKLADYGGKREREAWGDRAITMLAGQKSTPSRSERGELVVLAGKEYVDAIRLPAYDDGWLLVEPLAGMTLGARLAWLSAMKRDLSSATTH